MIFLIFLPSLRNHLPLQLVPSECQIAIVVIIIIIVVNDYYYYGC